MTSRFHSRRCTTGLVVLSSMLMGAGLLQSARAQTSSSADARLQAFDEISAELDRGGDLFVVANAGDALQDYLSEVVEVLNLIPGEMDPSAAVLKQVLPKVEPFLAQHGFFAGQGFGLSIYPTPNGQARLKAFVRRDPEQSGTALWRACVGRLPHAMPIHAYLPDDAVLVRSSTADLKALRDLIFAGFHELGGEQGRTQLEQGKQMAAALLGVPLDTLVDSVGEEMLLSLMLSETATVTLPGNGTQPGLQIPQPSFLVVLKVADDSIVDLIKGQFAKMQMTLPESESGDARIFSIPIPVPGPVPVQFTLARHGNYLLLGSSQDSITRALAAQQGEAGLLQSATYRDAFKDAPKESNGIIYVAKRLGELIGEIQKDALTSAADLEGGVTLDPKLVQRITGMGDKMHVAMTILNKPAGVLVSGETGMGARELVGASLAAPMGLMAAIAIPSFVKARSESQLRACINNLRILDAAKEQAALEQNWANAQLVETGSEEEAAALMYIKGQALPTCPKSGSYTWGVIGVDPTCTMPGHSL